MPLKATQITGPDVRLDVICDEILNFSAPPLNFRFSVRIGGYELEFPNAQGSDVRLDYLFDSLFYLFRALPLNLVPIREGQYTGDSKQNKNPRMLCHCLEQNHSNHQCSNGNGDHG
ncbi:MAG TPA: hypothetical protein VKW78_11690 [Terriglobales bacterium]|nr:hypothetical protein [Terriglobales bacterium]